MTDADEGNNDDAEVWLRGSARLNPTVAAFMRRGLDDHLASDLQRAGHTLGSLKQATDDALSALNLLPAHVAAIRQGARAEIPFDGLARVLWANRSTCCVCRQPGLAIIVHHIEPWAASRDHSDENLAVLCLEHHARAHTRGDLEQNLSPRRLRHAKAQWQEEVRHLDPQAILAASRINGHHWWWFNHIRLFELADALGIDLRELRRFPGPLNRGLIDGNGELLNPGDHTSYRYQGGDGNVLYAYVRELLETVLSRSTVFNISDDLDRGFLGRVVQPGDIVLVQGRHLFKQLSARQSGPGQASSVRRQANGVRVSFTIDRWEAVATSAWASWLRGAQNAASIVRIVTVDRQAGHLHLACTGLAMGFALQGLSNRSYLYASWTPSEDEEEEEDWLAGFGDEDDLGSSQ